MFKLLLVLIVLINFSNEQQSNSDAVDCSRTLRMGQFLCPDPSYNQIDPKTQQYRGCSKENIAKGILYY